MEYPRTRISCPPKFSSNRFDPAIHHHLLRNSFLFNDPYLLRCFSSDEVFTTIRISHIFFFHILTVLFSHKFSYEVNQELITNRIHKFFLIRWSLKEDIHDNFTLNFSRWIFKIVCENGVNYVNVNFTILYSFSNYVTKFQRKISSKRNNDTRIRAGKKKKRKKENLCTHSIWRYRRPNSRVHCGSERKQNGRGRIGS